MVPGDTGWRGVTWANCAGLVAGAGDSNNAGHGDVVGWLLAAVPSVVSVVAGGDENLTCVDSGDCAVSMLGITISEQMALELRQPLRNWTAQECQPWRNWSAQEHEAAWRRKVWSR
jgi:hypothetical protein